MKKNKPGFLQYVLMGFGLVGFIIVLPILVPIELWMRYKENKEQKKRMLKDV